MIRLRNVTKRYRLGDTELSALEAIDLEVARGELVALTGPSGSGKSTLMNVLGCLDAPTSGTYQLDGVEVAHLAENDLARVRNRKLGFVFQNFHLLPRVDALDNVAQPLVYRGVPRAERRRRAEEALVRVGLGHRLRHRPNELSGGQRQRVGIARALVGAPDVVLADEPTGNLDSRTAGEIMEIFEELHAAGLTLVIVTHETAIASRCRRSVRLHDGRIAQDEPSPGPTAP